MYEALKADWVRSHPDATNEEYQVAMRLIAEKCGI